MCFLLKHVFPTGYREPSITVKVVTFFYIFNQLSYILLILEPLKSKISAKLNKHKI